MELRGRNKQNMSSLKALIMSALDFRTRERERRRERQGRKDRQELPALNGGLTSDLAKVLNCPEPQFANL